jgi:hypothetical protein
MGLEQAVLKILMQLQILKPYPSKTTKTFIFCKNQGLIFGVKASTSAIFIQENISIVLKLKPIWLGRTHTYVLTNKLMKCQYQFNIVNPGTYIPEGS